MCPGVVVGFAEGSEVGGGEGVATVIGEDAVIHLGDGVGAAVQACAVTQPPFAEGFIGQTG